MRWIRAIVVGLLSAIAGCVGLGAFAALCVDWHRISSFEGNSGYFVVGLALVGIPAGFIIGAIWGAALAGRNFMTWLKALGGSLGTMLVLLLCATGLSWLTADFPPTIDGKELALDIEVQLPAGQAPPTEDAGYSWNATITSDGPGRRQSTNLLRVLDAREENGAWIVPAQVDLDSSYPGQALGIIRKEDAAQYFRLTIPAKPTATDIHWSPWQSNATYADLSSVPTDAAVSVRYRVVIAPPLESTPRQGPSEEEKHISEQTSFAALTPASPFDEWLAFTHYSKPSEIRSAAARAIASREDAVASLEAAMASPEPGKADLAWRAISLMNPPPAGIASALHQAGRKIADEIRKVSKVPVESDPSYEAAGRLSSRFIGWSEAARTLQDHDIADFRLEFQEIHDASAGRKDSIAMQDVARISAFYLGKTK